MCFVFMFRNITKKRISNTKPHKQYNFNLINMMKPSSIFNQGMKPVIYSFKKALHR